MCLNGGEPAACHRQSPGVCFFFLAQPLPVLRKKHQPAEKNKDNGRFLYFCGSGIVCCVVPGSGSNTGVRQTSDNNKPNVGGAHTHTVSVAGISSLPAH